MLSQSLFDIGPPPPVPARFNMAAHTLAEGARAHPEKTALIVADAAGTARESWRYGALTEAVLATATGLRQVGVGRGDRVLLRLPNSSDFPVAFFGTVALGAVAVPTSPMLTEREVRELVLEVAPDIAIAGGDLALPADLDLPVLGTEDLAAFRAKPPTDWADTAADDPAFLVMTSGTGGRAKGVLHAHRAAWARRMMWWGWYGLGPDDRVLHSGAFNWTYTLGAGLTDPWAIGATAIIAPEGGAADLWPRLVSAFGATLFASVPGIYRQMLRAEGPLRPHLASLRAALSAGEKLADDLHARWESETGVPLFEALGMSEISTYISAGPETPTRPGTVGRPQPGRRVAIVDDAEGKPLPIGTPGHLAVATSDPGLFLGYVQKGALTPLSPGPWFLTGDRAAMDGDGYVTYHGRADDVMTAQGYRVSPLEVERVLALHPAVSDAAVAEVEVRPGVRIIAGFVVEDPATPLDHDALSQHCAQHLARYKCPKAFRTLAALPRTANGKVIRRALADLGLSDAGEKL
ncbi:MAG: AMP-binding protein [Pseudomonadota bacterium]